MLRDIKTKQRFSDENNKRGEGFQVEETGKVFSEYECCFQMSEDLVCGRMIHLILCGFRGWK